MFFCFFEGLPRRDAFGPGWCYNPGLELLAEAHTHRPRAEASSPGL